MYRVGYNYLVRPTGYCKYTCIRVPDYDSRLRTLTETNDKVGWTTYISYPYKPTLKEEQFQIVLRGLSKCSPDDITIIHVDDKDAKQLN
jgi:hypothetical protein